MIIKFNHSNFYFFLFSKVYCEKCLKDIFQEKLSDILKNSDWKCPFKKKLCKCVRCEKLKERNMRELMLRQMVQAQEVDTSKSLVAHTNPLDIVTTPMPGTAALVNLGINPSTAVGVNQNKLIKQQLQTKIKNLLDFNGTLITKVSRFSPNMKHEEILFYNKIIYDNLKKMERLVFIKKNY